MLRLVTSDGKVIRVSADCNTNSASMINADMEAATTAATRGTVDDEDDDASDTSGPIYSCDIQSKVVHNTLPSEKPQLLDSVDGDGEASGQVDAVAARTYIQLSK